jgi:ATP-binding cassette subfamily F protein 3
MRWHGWKITSRHGPEHSSSCGCWQYSFPVFAYTTSRSHDRAFLDAVSTDIIHQHSGRLDYYKGYFQIRLGRSLTDSYGSNFTQFYSTKSERERNLRREYDAQMEYRRHLQAFIDRWRYNANRAAQAQSKIKILEKVKARFCLSLLSYITNSASRAHSASRRGNGDVPVCGPVTVNASNSASYSYFRPLRFPETEKISPPLLQLSEVTFGYDPSKIILNRVNFDVGLDSRIAIVGSNGAGKSTMCVPPALGPKVTE